uniref:Quinolinate phosphoribosyl transferase C-terminal domain-containing protein n=1 Tax=Romanomermis culicivorax TaxID=13658 RepID=A0A915KTV6_ROMCU
NAKRIAKLIKKDYPHKIVEVSGGVNASNVHLYCSSNIDVISMGCLTQGYPCIDFSLKL